MLRSILLCLLALPIWGASTVSILTTDNRTMDGQVSSKKISVRVGGQVRDLPWERILSIHNATAASAMETEHINKSIQALQGSDRKEHDLAVEVLSNMGMIVMAPLLKAYKDTDQHEPKPLYRLFDRIMPTGADSMDRTLSVIRLVGGEVLRGSLVDARIQLAAGAVDTVQIRRLAVQQKMVTKHFDIHSLRHSTQIEYLDSGVMLSSGSTVTSKALGVVRLSWETDSWASDADGIKVPGAPSYKTNLVDGFPFGAMVGRVGAGGDIWLAGANLSKTNLPFGRLYFAVNDNKHWQNNIGGFRVELHVTNGYDLGDPQ